MINNTVFIGILGFEFNPQAQSKCAQNINVGGHILPFYNHEAKNHLILLGLPLCVELCGMIETDRQVFLNTLGKGRVGVPTGKGVAGNDGGRQTVGSLFGIITKDIAVLNVDGIRTAIQHGFGKVVLQICGNVQRLGISATLIAIFQIYGIAFCLVVDLYKNAAAYGHSACYTSGIAFPLFTVENNGPRYITGNLGSKFFKAFSVGDFPFNTADFLTVGIQIKNDKLIFCVSIGNGDVDILGFHLTADNVRVRVICISGYAVRHIAVNAWRGNGIGLVVFQNRRIVINTNRCAVSVHVVDGQGVSVLLITANNPKVVTGHCGGTQTVLGLPIPREGVTFPFFNIVDLKEGVNKGSINRLTRLIFFNNFFGMNAVKSEYVVKLEGLRKRRCTDGNRRIGLKCRNLDNARCLIVGKVDGAAVSV